MVADDQYFSLGECIVSWKTIYSESGLCFGICSREYCINGVGKQTEDVGDVDKRPNKSALMLDPTWIPLMERLFLIQDKRLSTIENRKRGGGIG